MKARIAFDTLAYANRLKAAGLDTRIAEVQAEVNADMIANLLDSGLVTKQDLVQTQTHLELQIHNVKTDLEKQLADTRTYLEKQLADTRTYLEKQIADTRTYLEKQYLKLESNLRQDIKSLETKLTIRMGAMMVGCMALFSGMPSILHIFQK